MSHLSVAGLFLESDAELLKPLTGLLDVVDGDGNVAKSSTGVRVSISIALEARVALGSVVVGKLEYTWKKKCDEYL